MMEEKTPLFPALGEMGKILSTDTDGVFHRQIVKRITEKRDALRQTLDGGVEADKSAALQKEMSALDAASRIVDLVWHIARHAENAAAR